MLAMKISSVSNCNRKDLLIVDNDQGDASGMVQHIAYLDSALFKTRFCLRRIRYAEM